MSEVVRMLKREYGHALKGGAGSKHDRITNVQPILLPAAWHQLELLATENKRLAELANHQYDWAAWRTNINNPDTPEPDWFQPFLHWFEEPLTHGLPVVDEKYLIIWRARNKKAIEERG